MTGPRRVRWPPPSSSWSSRARSPRTGGPHYDRAVIPYWLDEPAIPRRSPTASRRRVVVGGGVTGCSCALTLAEAGLRVRLVDDRGIAEGASGRNGGFALRGWLVPYDVTREMIGADPARRLWRSPRRRSTGWSGWRAMRSALGACGSPPTGGAGRAPREYEALSADGIAAEWREPLTPARGPVRGCVSSGRRRAAARALGAALAGLASEAGVEIVEPVGSRRRGRRRDRRRLHRRLPEWPARRARGPDRPDAGAGDRHRADRRAAVRGAALRAARLRLLAPDPRRPHCRRWFPRHVARLGVHRRRGDDRPCRARWRRSSSRSRAARYVSTTAGRGSSAWCSTSCRWWAACRADEWLGGRRLLRARQRARLPLRRLVARAITGEQEPLLDLFDPERLLG